MSQLQLQDFSALYGVLADGNASGEALNSALNALSATARARNMDFEALLSALEQAGISVTEAARQWLANDFTPNA